MQVKLGLLHGFSKIALSIVSRFMSGRRKLHHVPHIKCNLKVAVTTHGLPFWAEAWTYTLLLQKLPRKLNYTGTTQSETMQCPRGHTALPSGQGADGGGMTERRVCYKQRQKHASPLALASPISSLL